MLKPYPTLLSSSPYHHLITRKRESPQLQHRTHDSFFSISYLTINHRHSSSSITTAPHPHHHHHHHPSHTPTFTPSSSPRHTLTQHSHDHHHQSRHVVFCYSLFFFYCILFCLVSNMNYLGKLCNFVLNMSE